MKINLMGFVFGGVEECWVDYGGQEVLYFWICNFQVMIVAGDNEYVNQFWNIWGLIVMNFFLNLMDEEIVNILVYIDGVYQGIYFFKIEGDGGGEVVIVEKDNIWLFIGLVVVFGLLVLVLVCVVFNFNYMIKVKEIGEQVLCCFLVEVLISRGVIVFVVFVLIVLGGYIIVNNVIVFGCQ